MAVRQLALSCVLLVTWVAHVAPTAAADLGPLAKYLTSDAVAVGYLDLTKFNAAAAVDELAKLGVMSEGEIANARQEAAQVQAFYDELTKRGGRRALVLLRLADMQDGGPTWLVEVAEDGDPAAVLALLTSWRDAALAATQTPQAAGPGLLVPQELKIDGRVIVGGTAEELAQLGQNAMGSQKRPEAAAAIEALLAADGGFVAFGDADSRRVLREMFPKLPDPFAKIDGKLLADGVSWAGVTVKLPPTPTISVTVEATSPEIAGQLQEAANSGLTMLKGIAMAASVSGDGGATAALSALALLKPEVSETRLSITIGDDPQDLAAFRTALAPAVSSSREAAWRSQRMNNFKQISLGMLNYHDAKGSYPPTASRDSDGKPLLSWRVMILPFLDQGELYKQFHLDEPWDSEHNRTLVAKMPAVYADPAAPDLAAAGWTTYLVPVGAEMLFHGAEGTKIRDITDGTSQTILAVEVPAEAAVEWTKPADWEVDLSDPLKGVRRKANEARGDAFVAAWCDGSVRSVSGDVDAAVFKALLTIAGEEVSPAVAP
jgi:hypothetical protein